MQIATYDATVVPRIRIEFRNRLRVIGHAGDDVTAAGDPEQFKVRRDGELLIIAADDDLTLTVPQRSRLQCRGDDDLEVHAVAALEQLQVDGDVVLRRVGACSGVLIDGDLQAEGCGALVIERIDGDVSLVDCRSVRLDVVESDLRSERCAELILGRVDGDANLIDGREVRIGQLNGDLRIVQATTLQAERLRGDVALRQITRVEIGELRGDLQLEAIEDAVCGRVGGDARLTLGGRVTAQIGGDCRLQLVTPAAGQSRLRVDGDLLLTYGANADMRLQGSVVGDISGVTRGSDDLIDLTVGDGRAKVEVIVGGDLAVREGRATGGGAGSWREFGRDLRRIGRELAEKLRGALVEIEPSQPAGPRVGIAAVPPLPELPKIPPLVFTRPEALDEALRGLDSRLAQVGQEIESRLAQVGQEIEKAERDQSVRAGSLTIQVLNRRWVLTPEQVARLRERASNAAESGIADALAAVERVLGRGGVVPTAAANAAEATAPVPAAAPAGSVPADAPPAAAATAASGGAAATGATIRIAAEPGADAAGQDTEDSRAAILRMVADGYLTVDEGVLLLEALGDQSAR